ncbi:hypothetical protein H0I76_03280 [Limibaculum sp. M0105]|uniref:Enoyl-CoA hydratase/isomerase family protein n=1 Tax=Thermohalobaculum xanthum TaxID=2753746 RepID=A0A8J7M4W3_9RHOB|nr:hypothetical protein [Thermohalobaculum xanthum]MBK0398200.1 hypothetical protein [Thermohalobaculum xanthum]
MGSSAATLSIAPGTGDADLAGAIRRALRDREATALSLQGDVAAGTDDAQAFARWVMMLADAPLPVAVAAGGELGPRGLALLLLADIAIVDETAAMPNPTSTPALAALAARALGPVGARRLVFGAADPVATLVASGHAERTADPEAAMAARIAALGSPAEARRRRAALNASRHLNFSEALDFDLWFHTGKDA